MDEVGHSAQRTSLRVLVGLGLLWLLGALLHALIPEPMIPTHSHPVVGDVLVNEAAGERIVFRRVPPPASDGPTVIDVHLEPQGAVPIAHVHPGTDEVFRVLKGVVRFVIDGKERIAKTGESVTVPAGRPHAVANPHESPAKVQVHMTPSGDLNIALTQVHGFLNETGHQGGLSEFLQMLRFADRYAVYRGDLPVWFQRLGITMIAPVARVLGFRSFYETYCQEARDRNPNKKADP